MILLGFVSFFLLAFIISQTSLLDSTTYSQEEVCSDDFDVDFSNIIEACVSIYTVERPLSIRAFGETRHVLRIDPILAGNEEIGDAGYFFSYEIPSNDYEIDWTQEEIILKNSREELRFKNDNFENVR